MHRHEPHSQDLAACRRLLHRHARSFHVASLLLPPAVRDAASVLYAFCRVADDAVDLPGGGSGDGDAIARLRHRLDAAYQSKPMATAVDRALAAVLQRYDIPRLLPESLLEGLAWDVQGRRYETLDELFDYAARVAGTVGAMMALLMGVRTRSGLARACDLGVAMQLSNIARDVAEDAAIGRLYLPRQWLREAGIAPQAWLAQPAFTPALATVVQRLLREADALYARAAAGNAALPLACRPGINAARLLYAAIGHRVADQIARPGGAGWHQRATVPRRRKAWLLARAIGLSWTWPAAQALHAAPLPATRALVLAAASECAAEPGLASVVDLFLRLEQRDRGQRAVPHPEALS